jgi:hypothetical protein
VLLNAVVNARNNTDGPSSSKDNSSSILESYLNFKNVFNLKKIWRWRQFHKYVQFVVILASLYAFLYWLLWNPIFISFTGYLSNTFDAMVALPQFVANFKNGYIRNLR